MTFFDVVQCPVEFESDRGKIVVHDGMAAGAIWLFIEFLEGNLKGKKLWMMADDTSAEYFPHTCDDGFLFNVDPSRGEHTGCIHDPDGYTLCEGGEFLPELAGLIVSIK
jgi:hypothetical protein